MKVIPVSISLQNEHGLYTINLPPKTRGNDIPLTHKFHTGFPNEFSITLLEDKVRIDYNEEKNELVFDRLHVEVHYPKFHPRYRKRQVGNKIAIFAWGDTRASILSEIRWGIFMLRKRINRALFRTKVFIYRKLGKLEVLSKKTQEYLDRGDSFQNLNEFHILSLNRSIPHFIVDFKNEPADFVLDTR